MKTKAASLTMVSALISALLVFVGEFPGGLALPSTTAPAFLWSPHLDDEYECALFLSFFSYLLEYVVVRNVFCSFFFVWMNQSIIKHNQTKHASKTGASSPCKQGETPTALLQNQKPLG